MRLARSVKRALLAAGLLATGGLVGVGAANAWVLGHGGAVYERAQDVPARAVAIVPGAAVLQDGTPRAALEDRLAAALELYRLGKVRRILVSGDHQAEGYDEVNGMHRWLVARGVPSEAVFLDHAGLRTLDTMVRAAKVFQVHDAVVCTQRFHLARSVFLARSAGLDAVGLVADRREYVTARWDAVREAIARTVAVADVHLLGTEPRFLGDPLPITGDARATHDRWTQRDDGPSPP